MNKTTNYRDISLLMSEKEQFRKYKISVISFIKSGLFDKRFSPSQKQGFKNLIANYSLYSIRKRRNFKRKHGFAPDTYVVGITDYCNLHCEYCYPNANPRNSSTLRLDTLGTIFKEMRTIFGIRAVAITGGEPFPRILDIAKLNPRITFYTYTNATFIDRDIAKRLKTLGNVIPSISIIGDEITHDKIRGNGNYKKIMSAISFLNNENIVWGFSITESKLNIDSILHGNFISEITTLKPYFMRMMPFMPVGRMDKCKKYILSSEERSEISNWIHDFRNNHKLVVHDYINDHSLGIPCMIGGNRYFYINPDLKISPCVFMDSFEQIEINKRDTNIVDILVNSQIFKNARAMGKKMGECVLLGNPRWIDELHK